MKFRPIDPGGYPHWMEFEKKTVPAEKDDFGASIEEWDSDNPANFETWGAFEPAGGKEFPMSQKRQAESVARIRIPFRSDVNIYEFMSMWRIVHGGQTWDIKAAMAMPAGVPIEMHFEVSEVR